MAFLYNVVLRVNFRITLTEETLLYLQNSSNTERLGWPVSVLQGVSSLTTKEFGVDPSKSEIISLFSQHSNWLPVCTG
jgi:hypothetical protein